MTAISSALPSSRAVSIRRNRVSWRAALRRFLTFTGLLRGMAVTSNVLTDLGGGVRVEHRPQENPRRRFGAGELPRRGGGQTVTGKAMGGQRGQSPSTIRRARKDRNGERRKNFAPAAPMTDLRQIVRAHQPDESGARKARLQGPQRVTREGRTEPAFDVQDTDARVADRGACVGQPPRRRRHVFGRLERILRRHQPPHLVEPEPPQRLKAQLYVAAMGRIERAAEQADAARRRMADAERGERQGRTWPSPRTTYLKLVSCSAPTGPRGGSRPVEMPISAPMPNSPPSANWVEALIRTIALSTSFKNFSAAVFSSVTIASVWCEP